MFLSRSREALACSLATVALLCPSRASADAPQCVQQNNSGAELRANHHLLAAREAYRACVAESACPDMVHAECEAALGDLKTALPTLLVAVLDGQGHDLPGATLVVDGRTVPIDGSPLEVDPGTHELTAGSGALSSHLQVMAIENDANRHIAIVLNVPKEPSVEAPAPSAPATGNKASAGAPRARLPAYVLGGVAAVGAASFGYFAVSGHRGLGQLNECKPYCA